MHVYTYIHTQCNFKNLSMNFKLHHRSQIWPTACVCFNKVLLVHSPNPLTHMLSVAAFYYHGKGKYFPQWLHGRQSWEHLLHSPLQVALASTCLRALSIKLQQLQKRPISESIGNKTESSSLQTNIQSHVTWHQSSDVRSFFFPWALLWPNSIPLCGWENQCSERPPQVSQWESQH